VSQPAEHRVTVDGASIFYRPRGGGPVLLPLGGGLPGLLAQPADDPPESGVALHAADARRIIADLGAGPVAVFGTCCSVRRR
jgi:hypothetical protein